MIAVPCFIALTLSRASLLEEFETVSKYFKGFVTLELQTLSLHVGMTSKISIQNGEWKLTVDVCSLF